MRSYFPFSDYDFWGYLASGMLIAVSFDYVLAIGWFADQDWSIKSIVLTIAGSYVLGHVGAQFSSLILEDILVGRVLRRPTEILMAMTDGSCVTRFFLPRYYRQLSVQARNLIAERTRSEDGENSSEDIFQFAFANARRSQIVMQRLGSFLNLYGFCRNTTFALFASALALFVHEAILPGEQAGYLSIIALLGAAYVMFNRYLKFYTHYAREILTFLAYETAEDLK